MISPFGPICPAAAEPIEPKMPAPITAPIANMIRSPAPRDRFSAPGCSVSATRSLMGLRENRDDIAACGWEDVENECVSAPNHPRAHTLMRPHYFDSIRIP